MNDQVPPAGKENESTDPASEERESTNSDETKSADQPAGATDEKPAEGPKEPPLRSVHTSNFPAVLDHFGCSLLVTTYQAGKLVICRSEEEALNTHFRTFRKPMGMAFDGNRLAIGTAQEIWEFRNVPAVAPKIEPKGKVDACFMPRTGHVTGDIQIHEMAFTGDELWFVNTSFSCLCTYDREYSFVPRWKPSFITEYEPTDRCHLNGMDVVDGKPKWVSALGTSNVARGWRENKKSGGVVIDVESQDIVCEGLSMPHSPRWYQNRLWLLESGNGSFGFVDLKTGKYESIVDLPGFTRGLAFAGNLAFIGLSQVRETAIFSGIKITEKMEESERNSGVWVVDIRNGEILAFLKFEDAVQEIFAVAVLGQMRFPDLINHDPVITGNSFVLPDEALRQVPKELLSTDSEQPLTAEAGEKSSQPQESDPS